MKGGREKEKTSEPKLILTSVRLLSKHAPYHSATQRSHPQPNGYNKNKTMDQIQKLVPIFYDYRKLYIDK